jgi:hypothetical protein
MEVLPRRITSVKRRAIELTHNEPRASDLSLAVGFGLSSGDSDSLPGSNLPKRNCVVVLFIGFVLVEDSKMKSCFQ